MRGISARLSGLQQQFLQRISSANDAAALNAVRLTTGKKINTPADDPSGFVALDSLETQLAAINETVARVSAAADLVAQAQLTLDQSEATLTAIRDLLITDEGRVLDSSGRAAAQAEIDAALDDLNGFAATEINGRRVLNGSASFRTSGVNTSQIASLRVFTTAGVDVEGSVIQSATQATLTYTGASGQITDDADITLTGATGNISLSVVSGTSLADVAADINDYSHLSGVTAEADGDHLIFTAVEAGSANTVEVTDETAEQLLLAENQAISSNALASLSILQQQNFNVTAILSALAGF